MADSKSTIDDLSAELVQTKKEARSTQDTLFRTNISKNEAEKRRGSLKVKVEALEQELAKARSSINAQQTWVTQSEDYRTARERLRSEVSDLKTTLANQRDQASSSSQKSAATESHKSRSSEASCGSCRKKTS